MLTSKIYENIKIEDIPAITFSIVSHGHGDLIKNLFHDLSAIKAFRFDVRLTINIHEDETFIKEAKGFNLLITRNEIPKGFGENHNNNFAGCKSKYFVVMNPDIRLNLTNIHYMLTSMSDPSVGLSGPLVYSTLGKIEDSARRSITITRLIKRYFFRERKLDYVTQGDEMSVDWLAGMFLVFDRVAYESVSGFDERYFMYCEDADICRRLKIKKYKIILNPAYSVVHEARRSSRRNFVHFIWHMKSLWRYIFFSPRLDETTIQ